MPSSQWIPFSPVWRCGTVQEEAIPDGGIESQGVADVAGVLELDIDRVVSGIIQAHLAGETESPGGLARSVHPRC